MGSEKSSSLLCKLLTEINIENAGQNKTLSIEEN